MEIGDRLRLIPQARMAARLGVDPSYLSLVFRGQRTPSARLLVGIWEEINLLGGEEYVSVDELVVWFDSLSNVAPPGVVEEVA